MVALTLTWSMLRGASAGDVSISISAYETYVGRPVTIQVTVDNAKDHDPPEFPTPDGAEVVDRGRSEQSFVSITPRGRVDRTSYTYTYDVIPRRAGSLTIPPIVVRADGATTQTSPIRVTVRKSETGDLLFVELKSDRESVYVGEPTVFESLS